MISLLGEDNACVVPGQNPIKAEAIRGRESDERKKIIFRNRQNMKLRCASICGKACEKKVITHSLYSAMNCIHDNTLIPDAVQSISLKIPRLRTPAMLERSSNL